MGSWFSNLHIRKTEEITKELVCDCIRNIFDKEKCMQVECIEDADFAVTVFYAQDSNWISVCSRAFAHDDPDSCKNIASPLSAQLHTDVMGIACFDSDYLYLNLINTDECVDAWIGIGAGKELGITRRNNVTAWKKKVADYPAFSAAAKGTYICAEDFLAAADNCLGLPPEQGSISLDYVKGTALLQKTIPLYFRVAEGSRSAEPGLEICYMNHALPCFDGKKNSVTFLNAGNEFRGLSIYFIGSFVEHEEIIFTNISFGNLREPFREMELKKIQLPDGQWAYCSHIPDVIIPPGIRGRMKPEKRYQLEQERMRKITFVPHGNPRKMLDITILITPDGDPGNQAKWNVWQQYGSKEEFIKHHNKIWKQIRAFETNPDELLPLLKLKDFDE